MLNLRNRYLFQLVNALDGVRSEPFVTNIPDFVKLLKGMTDQEQIETMVLPLMDVTYHSDDNIDDYDLAQRNVFRFPLFRVVNFVNLNFQE